MGNYYCKKCSIPLDYYSNIETSRINNCRDHRLLDNECKDCNGAKNIYKIAFNYIHKKDRPNYLCRSNKSGVLHDTSKSKFTRLETVKHFKFNSSKPAF